MNMIKIEPYIPTDISIEEVSSNRIKISAYPFESGYAITLAHPLRRLLLLSSVGYAPTALKIQGVTHEFDSIRGIVEDVSHFISNLKNIRFLIKDETLDSVQVHYEFKGPMVLSANELTNESVDVVNPEAYLATINENASISFSLIVQKGIGYVPSESIRGKIAEDYIPLDAYFTPVKKAIYEIENVLVEDNPNYEKIIFDIETDGQIEPLTAFKEAISVMHKQMSIFGVDLSATPNGSKSISEDSGELKTLMIKIDTLNLSARCFNCLDRSGLKYVGELVIMSENELKNIKNMGKKSYDEITEKLEELGYPVGGEIAEDILQLLNRKLAKIRNS
ncbi:DNA-directed RNA polymerase subunit alpha [Helicobacter cinaedi]|uniref:DNA-directed RNA polymerase subunit alpha n=1 Tax=Helicobacter cinaedi TaxID=213 RepID=UPI000CF0DBC7|nr:DNA-directed RNA polymerase subunit alpha [Helicobacter cinaedi]AWK61411.1 DNA-directed RNA polymerase subunit alpha [Helicobacter cinaedi]QOQ96186.1 DNA-directed RNA polymerase subunit alpha [Helicobacter cinaedi]